MTEADIQRSIIAALEAAGAVVMRMNAGKARVNIRMTPAGTPDLLAIGRHRTYWVEVKTPEGKLRPAQVEMIELLQQRGHEVVVARGIEDLPLPI